MGWSSGSELLERVLDVVLCCVPSDKRRAVAENLVDAFEDFDCDTVYEVGCKHPIIAEIIDARCYEE